MLFGIIRVSCTPGLSLLADRLDDGQWCPGRCTGLVGTGRIRERVVQRLHVGMRLVDDAMQAFAGTVTPPHGDSAEDAVPGS